MMFWGEVQVILRQAGRAGWKNRLAGAEPLRKLMAFTVGAIHQGLSIGCETLQKGRLEDQCSR